MNSVVLTLLMDVVVLGGGGSTPYDQAYSETLANGRPLLVLVGADWCPGCKVMKHEVLTRMQQQGRLDRVNYTVVDADAHSEMAGRLLQGPMIPQLIAFSKNSDGKWRREQIIGAASEAEVASLIDRVMGEKTVSQVASETVLK